MRYLSWQCLGRRCGEAASQYEDESLCRLPQSQPCDGNVHSLSRAEPVDSGLRLWGGLQPAADFNRPLAALTSSLSRPIEIGPRASAWLKTAPQEKAFPISSTSDSLVPQPDTPPLLMTSKLMVYND